MENKGEVKISFVMPVHNALCWIGEAASSVLMQTVREIELIIVDDCSTDGTSEFLDEWLGDKEKFPNVTIIHNEKNLGAGLSRNLGTAVASAPIIAFADADDICADERAALILKHFNENPTSELVTFPNMQIGYYNEPLEEFPGEPFDHERFLKDGTPGYYSNPASAAKKESLLAMGGFGKEEFTDTVKKTDDVIFVENWVKSGRKIDYQPWGYVTLHRLLPDSMMTKIRGFKNEWIER